MTAKKHRPVQGMFDGDLLLERIASPSVRIVVTTKETAYNRRERAYHEVMMRYSKERKEAVLKKMLPPENKSIPELAREEGISEPTLYLWRTAARATGRLLPHADSTPEGWTSADKFAAVVETAAMNEAELTEYCRQRGLYPEQIRSWRHACEQANNWEVLQAKQSKEAMRAVRKRTQELKRELHRKEKALAEAAALLVLEKKVDARWGEDEDE